MFWQPLLQVKFATADDRHLQSHSYHCTVHCDRACTVHSQDCRVSQLPSDDRDQHSLLLRLNCSSEAHPSPWDLNDCRTLSTRKLEDAAVHVGDGRRRQRQFERHHQHRRAELVTSLIALCSTMSGVKLQGSTVRPSCRVHLAPSHISSL